MCCISVIIIAIQETASVVRLRKRESTVLSFDECEYRALLHKEWARSKMLQHKLESVVLSKLIQSQEQALEELKFESMELYNMAIQVGMLARTHM